MKRWPICAAGGCRVPQFWCPNRALFRLGTLSRDRGARIGERQLEAAAITVRDINLRSRSGTRTLTLRVSKPRRQSEAAIPPVVGELSRLNGVAGLDWRCLD
jgi:hypothetical protein